MAMPGYIVEEEKDGEYEMKGLVMHSCRYGCVVWPMKKHTIIDATGGKVVWATPSVGDDVTYTTLHITQPFFLCGFQGRAVEPVEPDTSTTGHARFNWHEYQLARRSDECCCVLFD